MREIYRDWQINKDKETKRQEEKERERERVEDHIDSRKDRTRWA